MTSQLPVPTPDYLLAVFGKALYLAQSMEIGMRIFYWLDKTLPDTPPGKSPRVDFSEDPLPENNINSLGGFIRQFRKELLEEGTVDTQTRSIMRKLEQAVTERNWLVHHYWGERAWHLRTPEGRETILAELQELISIFRYHDLMIRQMVQLILTHYQLEADKITSETFQAYLKMSEIIDAIQLEDD
jgi:hypothetical protein